MRAAFVLLLLTSMQVSCSRRASESTTLDLRKPPTPSLIRLVFAGDVMLSRGVRRAIIAAHNPALPFRKTAALFRAADIAFVNLESPFSDRAPYHQEGLIFHAPPDAIAGLLLAGIDVVSTANNHARDCGPHGVEYTVHWLKSNGIAPVGSSDSAEQTHKGIILVRHGVRFGFLAYTFDQSNGNWHDTDERIAVTDVGTMQSDVRALAKRCDIVIVSMHNGVEYVPQPTENQITFAHAAVDAGAVLVIGHHPHVVQPTELYKKGVIFYSLGNFIFDQYQRADTQRGEVAEIYFTGKLFSGFRALFVRITPRGPAWVSGPE